MAAPSVPAGSDLTGPSAAETAPARTRRRSTKAAGPAAGTDSLTDTTAAGTEGLTDSLTDATAASAGAESAPPRRRARGSSATTDASAIRCRLDGTIREADADLTDVVTVGRARPHPAQAWFPQGRCPRAGRVRASGTAAEVGREDETIASSEADGAAPAPPGHPGAVRRAGDGRAGSAVRGPSSPAGHLGRVRPGRRPRAGRGVRTDGRRRRRRPDRRWRRRARGADRHLLRRVGLG